MARGITLASKHSMQFDPPLLNGTLIKRYKRFLADVELPDGKLVTAHCANTGAMTGCAEPGFTTWLRFHNDPKRKLPCSWVLAQNHCGEFIGIDTHMANRLVEEALHAKKIKQLREYPQIKREVRYGKQNSRVDFLLTDAEQKQCYVEVKSVTLCLENGIGVFPDTVTERGRKHLLELTEMARQGHRVVLLYCAQHTGIKQLSLQNDIDPAYSLALEQAIKAGLEVLAYGCLINQQNSELNQQLPIQM